MTPTNAAENPAQSVSGKVSLIVGLVNILLLALSFLVGNFNKTVPGLMLFAFLLLLPVGLAAGIAAFISKRVWIGLVINLLLLILLISSVFIVYMMICCAPVPHIE